MPMMPPIHDESRPLTKAKRSATAETLARLPFGLPGYTETVTPENVSSGFQVVEQCRLPGAAPGPVGVLISLGILMVVIFLNQPL